VSECTNEVEVEVDVVGSIPNPLSNYSILFPFFFFFFFYFFSFLGCTVDVLVTCQFIHAFVVSSLFVSLACLPACLLTLSHNTHESVESRIELSRVLVEYELTTMRRRTIFGD